jgi:ferredoxin
MMALQESAIEGDKKASAVVSLSLTKPLGMVLEEVEESQPMGVYVQSVSETGSAHLHREKILGSTLVRVDGQDVTRLGFDQVIEAVAKAPSPVEIEFGSPPPSSSGGAATSPSTSLPIGTPVTIVVLGGKGSGPNAVEIRAKVGDNLRKTMLENGVEVYEGFQNLGNCGGAGQCGYCAVDLVESEGWLDRSDYEEKKLRRSPQARLSCLNSIQGPATLRKTKK